ncbi:hypothetical protein [Pseudomonas sp. PDM25]|uniref:hypothetical protein n=1 Tax=Pseudomonas sp. PDM25 TaxID=2854772 RepID=UPI001C44C0D6|nr:hypothetical protein [Pseudomonas sp. PDM25]MBV7510088.1 hypothetical protein [Pseudomonas sp. PDM25]
MSGKVLEFKAPAIAGQKKAAVSPAGARLADSILLQLLEEADAPAGNESTPAQIFDISQRMKGGPLQIGSQMLLRLTAPYTMTFWLS